MGTPAGTNKTPVEQSPPHSFAIGSIVTGSSGRDYQILSSFRGGRGRVYAVRETLSNCLLALKTFHERFLRDEAVRAAFLREAEIWIRIGGHLNCTAAYFCDEIAGAPFIALEYIAPDASGRNTLRAWLSSGPLPLVDALRVAIQCCDAMIHCRNRVPDLVHHDIKPENILIGAGGTAKLTDFGLARVSRVTISERAGAPAGTLPYMSPEQCRGQSTGTGSDIYSLGAVIYEMLTGRFLFPARTANEFLDSHLHIVPQLPRARRPEIPPSLECLVMRCLEKRAPDRFPNFETLRTELNAVYADMAGAPLAVAAPDVLEAWQMSNQGAAFQLLGLTGPAAAAFAQADKERAAVWEGLRQIAKIELGNQAPAYVGDASTEAPALVARHFSTGVRKDFEVGKMDPADPELSAYFGLAFDLMRLCRPKSLWEIGKSLSNAGMASELTQAFGRLNEWARLEGVSLGAPELHCAGQVVSFMMCLLSIDQATMLYRSTSPAIAALLDEFLSSVDVRLLDCLRGELTRQSGYSPEVRLVVRVLCLEHFLCFLSQLGLQPSQIAHDTFNDDSEGSSWRLLRAGGAAAVFYIRYIDNHYDARLWSWARKPRWRVAVRPVSMLMMSGVPLPFDVIRQIQSYAGQFPEDAAAKRAYERYVAQHADV